MGTHFDKVTSVKQQAELSENLKLITKLYGDINNRIEGTNNTYVDFMINIHK